MNSDSQAPHRSRADPACSSQNRRTRAVLPIPASPWTSANLPREVAATAAYDSASVSSCSARSRRSVGSVTVAKGTWGLRAPVPNRCSRSSRLRNRAAAHGETGDAGCAGSGRVIALSGLRACPTCLAAQSRSSSPTSKARPGWSSNSVIDTTRCSQRTNGSCGKHSCTTAGTRSTHRATPSSSPSRTRAMQSWPPSRGSARSPRPARPGRKVPRSRCEWVFTPARLPRRTAGTPVFAVHRAARIGAAGYGGQVLVSQATHTLLEDEEDDLGIEFRDLGSQPLKGLDRPVHLYQVAAPGLADPVSSAPRGG